VMVCASCAVSEPPCFEIAQEVPVSLTVSGIQGPGRFEPAPPAPAPSPPPSVVENPKFAGASRNNGMAPSLAPATLTPAAPDPPQSRGRVPLLAGGGLLIAGVAGALMAAKARFRVRW
jgi:hypothetical protein